MARHPRPHEPPREKETALTILLTGGNGFVGSRLARRLLALGHGVRAITRQANRTPELQHSLAREIQGDFVDPAVSATAAAGCDLVIHCAGTAGPELDPVRRVNVDGTRAMVDAALGAGATRFIHISTVSVYRIDDRPVVDEGTPLKTSGDPYGVTKAEGDRLVLAAAKRGLRATILRPGAILGVHPSSTWAVKVPERIRERQIKLRIDGGDSIPWVHVEDLADAVLLAIAREEAIGRVYNLVDGHTTWREYTDRVRGWFGTAPLDVIPRREVPAGGYWSGRVEAYRIRSELGYAPRRTFDEGMAEAGRFWRGATAR